MLHAGDVMTRPVVTARATTPLHEVGALLADYGYAGLPVVDGGGVLLGFVTSGDILRADRTRDHTAGEVMTSPAVAAEVSSDLDAVGRLLVRRGVRSVPVVDGDGRVVGVLSRGDLLRLNETSDYVVAAGVQKALDDYTGTRRWIAAVRDGDVTVAGFFDDDQERHMAAALARTVPGARAVRIGAAPASRG